MSSNSESIISEPVLKYCDLLIELDKLKKENERLKLQNEQLEIQGISIGKQLENYILRNMPIIVPPYYVRPINGLTRTISHYSEIYLIIHDIVYNVGFNKYIVYFATNKIGYPQFQNMGSPINFKTTIENALPSLTNIYVMYTYYNNTGNHTRFLREDEPCPGGHYYLNQITITWDIMKK
ncbi:MAG: hypothetical protein E6R13_01995 [Spirochaetes bacterium]|nr:MAG: hypothetical protein E6R13_01995 [Spirochaetota bacterium]